MCMALYGFVARRCNLAFAWAAMILPTCTFAMHYAYDARPYGHLARTERRRVVLLARCDDSSSSLAGSHGLGWVFGSDYLDAFLFRLILYPTRARRVGTNASRRRVDVGIWTAFALGLSPILGLTGLIQRNAQFSENFWAKPKWFRIVDTYAWLFEPAVMPLIAALTLILWMTISELRTPGLRGRRTTPIDALLVPDP